MKLENLSPFELEEQFLILQARMIAVGILKGLTHPDTLQCSQELDLWINRFQKSKRNKHKEG